MTSIDDDSVDFRSRAVAVSEAVRRELASEPPPEKCGISYCLEREPSLSRLRVPIQVSAIVCLLLALAAYGGALFFGFLTFANPVVGPPGLLAAVACFGAATLMMCLPTYVERLIVRCHLPRGDERPRRQGIHAALEDARTCSSLKLLAEDVGLIYMHPEDRYVKFAGLSYEYVIQGRDVVALSLRPNRKSVLISYMVGEEQLDLVIVPRGIRAELKRKMSGSSLSLFNRMLDALEPEASPE
jgi:hypothetical protein